MPDRPPESAPRARRPTILLVGHCFPDAALLRSALRSAAPDAEFRSINDRATLDTHLPDADLALVNRALDGDFGVPDGIALIRALTDRARGHAPGALSSGPAFMLVSNYPEAQAEAQAAGALPGVGKTQLHAPETRHRIADALARNLIR